jgi:citrate synthase
VVDQRGFDNQHADFLPAREAARLLGVKLQTLYAYASRGLVRSEPRTSGNGRSYARADLERLKARGAARSGHGPVAAGALRWGEPVLQTAVSSIRADGPAYRGESAILLARSGAGFEAVAERLWTGSLAADPRWPVAEAVAIVRKVSPLLPAADTPLQRLLMAVPHMAALDAERFGASAPAEWARARVLVRVLASLSGLPRGLAVALRAAGAPTVAESLAIALGVSPRRVRAALDGALILSADHELNASTFAARVVASTGADLYACVAGALAAMTGPAHGGASERVEAFLDEVGEPSLARAAVLSRSSRGESIPGFGHRLYPEGDPRTLALIEAAERVDGAAARLQTANAVARAMERAKRERPNLDFGLVAFRRGLGLPRGSASLLFAVGRIAGWVAHALEQREQGYLLRPRAEYVGK